ncbi:ABC transporter C-terminal domain-containing protein [Paenibacillus sp. D2_2]|uniref:ABC transporter C-terminal domain-containing protein n=1 Tax=Paenibacillus sp. D2_2 TaxID=3073092 RepID=UPI002815A6E2|nr:ABC transporter C-terminal domain-containing protein [Paenibacillus sp. D2_2]WMT43461.1 ABC transporter C-terminal domain-containing protein [Paenibacillus sp. D2_2]
MPSSAPKPQQSKRPTKPSQAASTPNPATIQKLERDIAELEQTLKSIHAAMLEPEATYDAGRLSELQTQQNQVQVQLDSLIEKYIQMLEDNDQ